LVGYWSFDEGSGTTAYDMSGNGNNGILVNGPTWTTGKVGGALSFDGVDDYVSTVNNMDFVNKDFTMLAWIKTNAQKPLGDYAIFNHGFRGTTCSGLHFNIRNDKPYFGLYSCDFGGSTYITAGLWYHFAFINNNSPFVTDKVFINGILDSQSTRNPYIGPSTQLRIGGGWYPPINGLIDEVRIYNRALSDAEIQAIYNAT
ncbi:MAG: LamG domain-containing protein, partial [Minisyncoccia bacterium]